MPFTLSVKSIDNFKRGYLKSFELVASDLATAITARTTIKTAYAGLTTGKPRKDKLSYPFSAETEVPASHSNRDVGVTFTGLTNDGDTATVKVASFDISLADSYGNVDLANVDVAAFLALFEAAGPCLVSDGEKVAVWIKGTLDK